jgi:hypothetical protein
MFRIILLATAVAAAGAAFGVYKAHEGASKPHTQSRQVAIADCHVVRSGGFYNSTLRHGHPMWFVSSRSARICRSHTSPTGWVKNGSRMRSSIALVSDHPKVRLLTRIREMFILETVPICAYASDVDDDWLWGHWSTVRGKMTHRKFRGHGSLYVCSTFKATKLGRATVRFKVVDWFGYSGRSAPMRFKVLKQPPPPSP